MLRPGEATDTSFGAAIVTEATEGERAYYYVGLLMRDRRPVFFSRHKGISA